MTRLVLVTLGVAALFGCDVLEETPCDRYADYYCTCHPEDPDGCEALLDLAAARDADQQDTCATDLADQRAQDEEDGVECILL